MTRSPHNCQARQHSDQMLCGACGLAWDVNDPDPPECRKVDGRRKVAREVAKCEPAPARVGGLPDKLPDDVATEMVKTYQANGGHRAGMQAAYRLFLDRVEP